MMENHRRGVKSEKATEHSGPLGFLADDSVFRLDAAAPDGKS